MIIETLTAAGNAIMQHELKNRCDSWQDGFFAALECIVVKKRHEENEFRHGYNFGVCLRAEHSTK
jgi:hypothetical protein